MMNIYFSAPKLPLQNFYSPLFIFRNPLSKLNINFQNQLFPTLHIFITPIFLLTLLPLTIKKHPRFNQKREKNNNIYEEEKVNKTKRQPHAI